MAAQVEGVRQTHHAQADGTMTPVGRLGRLGRVEIDVDDIVQRPHRHADRLAQFGVVERTVGIQVRLKDDRTQIADRRLVVRGVERDLRAEIRRVDHTDMILGERTLQASLKVIHGCPVSNSIESMRFHSSSASIFCP
jgi:hypothetical protein